MNIFALLLQDCLCFNLVSLSLGKNMNVQISNLCRECIREFFQQGSVLSFDRPTNDKKLLADIENASENQLNPKFQENKRILFLHLHQCKTKTLREGVPVTGNCKSFLSYYYENNILQIFYI